MKVILFGSTGMVGKSVLRQCLLDPDVESVLSIGRRPSGVSHPKLRDLVRADMFDFNVNAGELNGYDACFFCLGVSSVRMSEAEYTHLTYDLTMGWAHALARVNPAMRFLDTIGQKVGPLSMVDRFGTKFSAALHVSERYRLIYGATARDLQLKHESTYFGAGKSSPPNNPYGRGDIDPDATKPGLQVEITVDDPAVFTTPWSGLVTYRHVQGEWPEAVCADNTYGSGTSSHSTSSSSTCIFSSCLVPEADQSDF